jgi:hypothetical protein
MDSVIAAFMPFARKSGRVGGVLGEMVKCGGFMGAWKSYDFLIYQATVSQPNCLRVLILTSS